MEEEIVLVLTKAEANEVWGTVGCQCSSLHFAMNTSGARATDELQEARRKSYELLSRVSQKLTNLCG